MTAVEKLRIVHCPVSRVVCAHIVYYGLTERFAMTLLNFLDSPILLFNNLTA